MARWVDGVTRRAPMGLGALLATIVFATRPAHAAPPPERASPRQPATAPETLEPNVAAPTATSHWYGWQILVAEHRAMLQPTFALAERHAWLGLSLSL
jgi:hypothetical protein